MEANWIAQRSMLRHLLILHPTWSSTIVARCLGRSASWVKKWRKRFKQAAPDDQLVLRSRSRARHTPPPSTSPEVVQRILDLRDQPPENLQRVPGPRALLYYLPRHAEGLPQGVRLPRSTRTIWKILRQHGRIPVDRQPPTKPLEGPEPLQEIQIDFKDDSTVPADPLGKRQHMVETCNFVDAGTSIWLHGPVREDFTAETAFEAVVEFLLRYGLPAMLTFDRDPRWVGSASGGDFPSAFVRFLLCLGIQPNVCPSHRPDKNCYVERLHRTYKYECLLVHRSATVEQVTRPSPTRSCTITTRSDPIKDAPVRMYRPASPFQPCRSYLQSRRRWTRIDGCNTFMDGLLLAPSAQMAASLSMTSAITSSRNSALGGDQSDRVCSRQGV